MRLNSPPRYKKGSGNGKRIAKRELEKELGFESYIRASKVTWRIERGLFFFETLAARRAIRRNRRNFSPKRQNHFRFGYRRASFLITASLSSVRSEITELPVGSSATAFASPRETENFRDKG